MAANPRIAAGAAIGKPSRGSTQDFFPAKHTSIALDERDRACAKARELYGFDVLPRLVWDVRGLRAGRAHYTDMSVHLNVSIAQAEGEAFRQTVGHEVAHLVVRWQWGNGGGARPNPHGKEWRRVMVALGYEPRRCHAYASAKRVRRMRWGRAMWTVQAPAGWGR